MHQNSYELPVKHPQLPVNAIGLNVTFIRRICVGDSGMHFMLIYIMY